MKRKGALLLSAVMAASSLPMTAYAANFKDINDVPWSGAAAVINNVADMGLLSGYEDGTFRARNQVTYCEAMQMVYTALVKTGAATQLDAVEAYSYVPLMNARKIPNWAQTAVAYGLSKNIISGDDLAKFTTNGKSNPAPREAVAKMFGNALAVRYDVDGTSKAAAEFSDYWRISVDAMPQVDLLKRLGIVNGDNYNCFNPKNNINRAEMAVMLNKTHEVLTQGIGNTGVIKNITSNAGTYYYIEVEMDNGDVEGFHATVDKVKVYVGDTNQEMALSRVSKGDKISIIHNGGSLSAIRVLDTVPAQEKYDITGYITAMKDNTVSVENENTGDTDKYALGSDVVCYLEGVKVTRKELRDTLEDRYDEHAYAGIFIDTELQKVKDEDGKSTREEVETVTEIHVTFSDEYVTTGQVDSMSSSRMTYKASGTNAKKDVRFDADCEFYIGDDKASVSDMEEMVDNGTTYVKVTVNKDGDAIKVIFAEDTFDEGGSKSKTTTYEVVGFTDSRIIVESGGKKTTYTFGSSNPLKNINFYKWEDDEFTDVKVSAAESYYDDHDKVYCRIEFNKGGKISSIELSHKKSAWKDSEDQTERKGTVASLKNGELKFKTSSTTYKMLNKYNVDYTDYEDRDDDLVTGQNPNGDGLVRNPLNVTSSVTSSLTVFEKMANSDDVELYAEITADGNNNVVKVEARLTSAKGKLVEYERDADDGPDRPSRYMTIETSDGAKLKLNIVKTPKLTDEDEDTFTLDDVASTNYVGAEVELGFNSSGEINKITVTEESGKGLKRVKGIATAAEDGLEVKGDKGTYQWLGRSSIEIKNYSLGQSTSLDRLKDMIEDPDVEVYVEATLDDRERVESINVYVKSAEGKLEEYDKDDDIIRIKTDGGKSFSFDCVGKPKCDVDGFDREKLDDKCRGKRVELTFNSDGIVSEIEG